MTRALFAGVVALVVLLAGCGSSPPSKVVVGSGLSSTAITAQPKCVTAGSCEPDQSKMPTVTAKAGSAVQLDVPKELMKSSWLAQALNPDVKTGNLTAIDGAGTTVTLAAQARIQVPDNLNIKYVVRVTPTVPKPGTHVWMFWIKTD